MRIETASAATRKNWVHGERRNSFTAIAVPMPLAVPKTDAATVALKAVPPEEEDEALAARTFFHSWFLFLFASIDRVRLAFCSVCLRYTTGGVFQVVSVDLKSKSELVR